MRSRTVTRHVVTLWSAVLNRERLVRRAMRRALRSVSDVVEPLGETIARLFRDAARTSVPLLAVACGEPTGPASTDVSPPPVVAVAPDASVAPGPDAGVARTPRAPRSHGRFLITMYYVANEDEVDGPAKVVHPRLDSAPSIGNDRPVANDEVARSDAPGPAAAADGSQVATADDDDVDLAAAVPMPAVATGGLVPAHDRNCQPIVHVSRAFRRQLALQGTGQLRDGRMLNVASRCKCAPCFHVLPAHRKWGMGGSGMPLEPFRSVAVDPAKVKLGSLLYIPALDGLRMPGPQPVGGFVHDGCVVAADTGGNIDGAQLDLFVARRAYYNGLARRGGSHRWLRSVEVLDGKGRCQRKGGKVSQSAAGSI